MSSEKDTAHQIQQLVLLFRPLCPEHGTMDELAAMAGGDQGSWARAHALFDRIRDKTLAVDVLRNPTLGDQYSFEEVCAKTLYNFSDADEPFDPDSPYWVVPFAIALARSLKIEDKRVLEIVAA